MTAPRGRKVLVVDDNRDLRDILKLSLEAEGYAVSDAANAAVALSLARQSKPDILLTDLFMPDSDGFEAIDAFRKEFPGTKIVVMSGESRLAKGDYLSTAKLIGADATLRKPFETDELLRVLREMG